MLLRTQPAVAILFLGAVLAAGTVHAQWREIQELTASPVKARANLGSSLALDGYTLAVGAHGEDLPGAVNAGAVYLFELRGKRWVQAARLTASDAGAGDLFGVALALQGSTLVVGARDADPLGIEDAGAAYVFERRGGGWVEQARLRAPDAAAGDWFGVKVAIDGDTLIATARYDRHGGQYRAGSAYVFTRDGSGWTLEQKIVPDTPEFRGRFGSFVQLAGNEALVSATKREREYGSIYSFRRRDGEWTQIQRWFAPAREVYAEYGGRLALDGDLLLVGAAEENVRGLSNSGAAYLCRRQGDSWQHQHKLTASVPLSEAWFGRSVALWDPVAVVGAASLRAPARPGAAHVFARRGAQWVEVQRLVPGDGVADDEFGQSVAVEGPMVLVGAWKHDHAGLVDAGAVYVFTLSGPRPSTGRTTP